MERLLLFAIGLVLLIVVTTRAPAAEEWTDQENVAGVKKVELVRYAIAGHKMTLAQFYALDLDCSVIEGYAAEIIKYPEHGTAAINPQTFFPTFAKSNPRYRCNEQKIDGYTLTYTPSTNYKGPDSLTYLYIIPSGLAWEKTFLFNVRAAPAATTGPKKKDAAIMLPDTVVQ